MAQSRLIKPSLLLCIVLLLLLSLPVVHAQEQNLLTNPGFEGGFTSLPGEQPREVAAGWTPWHIPRTSTMPSFQNAAPKYQQVAPNQSRIRSGSNAQLYFSFFETHDGGLYQRVDNITPGTELRFSIYAYVWSSTLSDVNVSEDDGDVLLRVGIDPAGGTNPDSSTIIWSTPAEFYDTYRQYSVIATATSNAVTVWVRSTVGKPVQNSYIYLDDAVLSPTTDAGTEPPTSTHTATVTSTPTLTSTATATNTGAPVIVNTATATNTATVTSTPTITSTATNTPPPGEATPTQEVVDQIPPTSSPTPPGQVPTATEVPGTGGQTPIFAEFPGRIMHTVRRNDTVGAIAGLYGSSTEAIISANGLDQSALIFIDQRLVVPVRLANPATSTPSPTPEIVIVDPPAGPPVGGPDGIIYVVQRGDTLAAIARRYSTTYTAIAQLNGIANPNQIQVGQRLLIPGTGGPEVVPTSPPPPQDTAATQPPPRPASGPATYVVQPGDNLFRISLRFNVSLNRLAAANNISNTALIFVGQVLTIPAP